MAFVLPSFVIVGAMKSGTTTLGEYLTEHEEIHVPIPEIHFFDLPRNYERGVAWYERQFEGAGTKRIVGDKTGTYSYLPEVPPRIARALPHAKLIWIFREPVARTYSNYWHAVSRGNERLDFATAVEREPDRVGRDVFRGYVRRSIYVEQVRRYLDYF